MAPTGVDDLSGLMVRLAERSVDVIHRYRAGLDPGFEYISPAIERLTGYVRVASSATTPGGRWLSMACRGTSPTA